MNNTDEALLTPGEVAEKLKISKAMAYLIIKRGEMPSVRIGSLVRVRRADLERYIRDQMEFKHTLSHE